MSTNARTLSRSVSSGSPTVPGVSEHGDLVLAQGDPEAERRREIHLAAADRARATARAGPRSRPGRTSASYQSEHVVTVLGGQPQEHLVPRSRRPSPRRRRTAPPGRFGQLRAPVVSARRPQPTPFATSSNGRIARSRWEREVEDCVLLRRRGRGCRRRAGSSVPARHRRGAQPAPAPRTARAGHRWGRRSPLDAGARHALDDEPLREHVEQQHRHAGDHRAGHQQVVAHAVGRLQRATARPGASAARG